MHDTFCTALAKGCDESGGENAFIRFFFPPFKAAIDHLPGNQSCFMGPLFSTIVVTKWQQKGAVHKKIWWRFLDFFFFSPLNRWDLGCPCFPTMALRCFLSPHSRCCLNMKLFTVARGITLLSVLTNLFLMETALHLERIFNILEHFLIFFFFFHFSVIIKCDLFTEDRFNSHFKDEEIERLYDLWLAQMDVIYLFWILKSAQKSCLLIPAFPWRVDFSLSKAWENNFSANHP